MPFARLTTNSNVTPDSMRDLQTRLTDLIASVLAKKHELTSVLIDRVNRDSWTIGGGLQDEAAHLEVTVTTGTNSDEQKAAFLVGAMELLTRFFPRLHRATYIVVHEVPGTDWGYDGRSQAGRAAAASTTRE